MLDIKFIQANADAVKKAARDKGIKIDIDRLLELNQQRLGIIRQIEDLKCEQNKLSKTRPDAASIEKLKALKQEIGRQEQHLLEIIDEYEELMSRVPTVPAADVPYGLSDKENVEIYRWGEPARFDFTPKSHIELAEALDLLDFKRGAKVSGYRGYYVKNEAVLLEFGLMMYALEKLVKKGFTLVIPPTLIKEFALFGSGYFAGKKYDPQVDEIYKIANNGEILADGTVNKEDKFLVGTAEPSLLAYYAGEIIEAKSLPLKFCGFSQCYRSEIGSYGKNTKGIYRVHEFMKIEQVAITRADSAESGALHEELTAVAKELHEDLKIPYRQLLICTGDLGAGKYKQYDIEAWMPGINEYGETGSASNFLDWQARRLNVRYRDNDDLKYVHMINSTAVPSPRLIIAILENYQQADGSIAVPEVLQKYVGCEVIRSKK